MCRASGPREKGNGRLRGEDSMGCLWAVTGQTHCQREQRRGAETGKSGENPGREEGETKGKRDHEIANRRHTVV